MSENKKMKVCKSCGEEIAKSAKVCPHCGAKNKKPSLLLIICIVLVILGLAVSCSGRGESEKTPENAASNAAIETSKEEEIVYTNITVGTLMDDLEANALNAADTYKNHSYAVTGKLSTIDSSGKYISIVDPDDSFAIMGVQCYIKTEEVRNAVKDLSRDAIITVKGQITDVGEVLGYSMNIDSIE